MTSMPDSTRIRSNSLWMMADQVFRQSLGLLFSIWIARQYGPEGFGTLSFALSFCALFGIVGTLGLNRILVRELADPRSGGQAESLIGVVITLRLLAGGLVAVAAMATVLLVARDKALLVAILSIGFILTPFDSIDLGFQARLESVVVTRARMVALTLSSLLKAWLLLRHADLAVVAVAYVVDWAVAAAALWWILRRSGGGATFGLGDGRLWRGLLRESWPEIFAGFSALVFMRIDQVMLLAMRGAAEVGIMAVSSRLTEAWYFIPAALVSSTYPVIVALGSKDPVAAERRQIQLYRQLIALSVLAGCAATLLGDWAISIVFGSAYAGAGPVLAIQTWCGLFMSLGIASGTWLMANRLVRFNLYRNACGALVNVALNFLLIPRYGALGAAWATLAAFCVAYFLFDFLVPTMRGIGLAKLRAVGLGRG